MKLKERNNLKKFFKKYMIWIVLVVAILIIPELIQNTYCKKVQV